MNSVGCLVPVPWHCDPRPHSALADVVIGDNVVTILAIVLLALLVIYVLKRL